MSEEIEVEEKTEPVVEKSDGNDSRKGKILTLLFQPEAPPPEGKDAKKDKNKPPTKVVIRRLPPRLTKEGFFEQFKHLPNHDYFYFVRGDLSLGTHSFSRAYINFVNQDDIFAFKEKYDDFGIRDDKGKAYHAVVEFAPFQKVPRRTALKKILSKAGTLESDPKYTEFLQKLEDLKNNTTNTSEYFHETESSVLKTKITTTPLLEFLKQKKQKKQDLKNEIRQRKREAEKERKRKEEEKRKVEREKRKEEKIEKKSARYDEKKNTDDKARKTEERVSHRKLEEKNRLKEEKRDSKKSKDIDNDNVESTSDAVIPNDPAILKVVVRQSDKEAKTITKEGEGVSTKNVEGETTFVKSERKYSDFRTRLAEEKQRKTFHKRDSEESKTSKANTGLRKGVPDEKGDNYSIGNCSELKESKNPDISKRQDSKVELKETKSKFRYSEQRNRDREYRNQKTDSKIQKDIHGSSSKVKSKSKDEEVEKTSSVSEGGTQKSPQVKEKSDFSKSSKNFGTEVFSHSSRRKSLELDREVVDSERKRSKSFHDVSKGISDLKLEGRANDRSGDGNSQDNETGQSDDMGKENNDSERLDDDSKKDPRIERRIRNKDRPSIEIYRPGMGKFSKQRLEQKKDETSCTSPTGTPLSNRSNSVRGASKPNNKKTLIKNESMEKSAPKGDEALNKTVATASKTSSEVRTMTFTRSVSKEN